MSLRRLLYEPLLHFFVLGGVVFLLWSSFGGSTSNATIVVDQARVDALSAQYERTWQRPPTPAERQGLVDAWVREEVLYREGIAAGMARDDEVVRRRVVQKMTFFAETSETRAPTKNELQAWWRAHPEDYRVPPSYTLQQEFVDPVQGASMLPARLVDASSVDVARTFGRDFSKAIATLPTGRWSVPIRSGFGMHRVLIEARTAARVAPFPEVRAAVERDFLAARNQQLQQSFYESARRQYTVQIEAR